MTTHDEPQDVPAKTVRPSPSGTTAGGGPDRAGSLDGLSPLPLPTLDELLEILEHDGWREVEYELITRHGMTLHDLARRLHEVDAELSDV